MPLWLCAGAAFPEPIQRRNNMLRTSLHGDTDPAACDLFLEDSKLDIKDMLLGVLVATVLFVAMLLPLSTLVVLCVISVFAKDQPHTTTLSSRTFSFRGLP